MEEDLNFLFNSSSFNSNKMEPLEYYYSMVSDNVIQINYYHTYYRDNQPRYTEESLQNIINNMEENKHKYIIKKYYDKQLAIFTGALNFLNNHKKIP